MDVVPPREAPTLPEGACLLLIAGRHDGTIGAAVDAARETIGGLGVVVVDPAAAASGPCASGQRTIVTGLRAGSDVRAAGELLGGLGRDRTWIALTLPSVASIVAQAWQDAVTDGERAALEPWLEAEFSRDGGEGLARRWRSAIDERAVERWLDLVDADRLTAFILDETDAESGSRALEELLGLSDGSLPRPPLATTDQARPARRDDRGVWRRALTLPEVESVRALNIEIAMSEVPDPTIRRVVRAAAADLRRRDAARDEPPVRIPAWAVDRLRDATALRVRALEAAGCRIVERAGPPSADADGTPCVPPNAAAALAMGIVEATRAAGPNGSLAGGQPRWRRAAAGVRRRLRRAAFAVRALRLPGPWSARRSAAPARTSRDRQFVDPLPPGTHLVHIGPPKTGTTSLQASLHRRRESLLRHGVRYAGRLRHSASAVLAVTDRPAFDQDEGSPSIEQWEELVADAQTATEPRVVISSEFFADALPESIPRIVGDLGGDRVHVVITLRPLARIVPSQWQQYVQSGMRLGLDDWLRSVLAQPPGPATPTFQRRHRHADLVARWAEVVGRARVTVIVVDEHDRDFLFRVFEQLLDLPERTLEPEPDVTNRSMTRPEIEAVRAFNVAFRAAGLGNALFHRTMHFGAATFMKLRQPGADEARIELPSWAVRRCLDISRDVVAQIRDLGIHVVGDLAELERESLTEARRAEEAASPAGVGADAVCVTPEIAGRMAFGVALATGFGSRRQLRQPRG